MVRHVLCSCFALQVLFVAGAGRQGGFLPMSASSKPTREQNLKNGDATQIFKGLKIIVHAEGHMRTHVLRAHVMRHGGTLVTAGEGAHFLCCDKHTSEDKMKELWGNNSTGEWSVVDSTFISKSVIAQKQLSLEEFVLKGVVPVVSCAQQVGQRILHICVTRTISNNSILRVCIADRAHQVTLCSVAGVLIFHFFNLS